MRTGPETAEREEKEGERRGEKRGGEERGWGPNPGLVSERRERQVVEPLLVLSWNPSVDLVATLRVCGTP